MISDQILQKAGTLVLVANDKAEIIYASPYLKTILGYAPDEILGRKWWSIYDDTIDDIDKEIDFAPEESAVGINAYKKELYQMLNGKSVTKELHETLIEQIDEAAKTFNILILKTNMAIPYTSVFFRLGCGYWDAGAEETLRKELRKKNNL